MYALHTELSAQTTTTRTSNVTLYVNYIVIPKVHNDCNSIQSFLYNTCQL